MIHRLEWEMAKTINLSIILLCKVSFFAILASPKGWATPGEAGQFDISEAGWLPRLIREVGRALRLAGLG